CTRAFVRLIANWSMSMSETTPPNSVGRLSSLAAIREPTVTVELTGCYLGAAPRSSLGRDPELPRACLNRGAKKSGLTAQAGNNSTCARLDRRDFTEKSR